VSDYIAHVLANSSPHGQQLITPDIAHPSVIGVLMNDPAALAALGAAVHAPPYKAPPVAPVLYFKPRNTHARSGAVTTAPRGTAGLTLGACLGLVIGTTARRVPAASAWQHIGGWVLIADLSVPHTVYYRPSVRLLARDASCVMTAPMPHQPAQHTSAWAETLTLSVWVNDALVHTCSPVGMVRSAGQLLADVSDFMTLAVGDVLMLGINASAPEVPVGQRWRVAAPGFAALEGRVVFEDDDRHDDTASRSGAPT
jgi:5-oxopent-3-ene-1,2,5-tricarboxylate decarboxylase / 2-hydroxyhepta-2,4-diene-1,7-dioate isomerase